MSPYRKILVIRLSGIGDIIFTLPAVNLIKDNYPDAEITFLTKRTFADLIRGFPSVANVIAIESTTHGQKNIFRLCRATVALIKQLRRGRFDLVVDFHGITKTALIAWLTGAKERWGLFRKQKTGRFYSIRIPYQNMHRIDLKRSLLQTGGMRLLPARNQFVLPEPELAKAQELLNKWGVTPSKPTILIQPFTNYAVKNWPLDNYLALADYWNQKGAQIIFSGGPKDREQLSHLPAPYRVSAGKASLLVNAGLIKLSTLMVSGDTGLAHLAVAMGSRVLMLMPPTGKEKFLPYGHPDWALLPQDSLDIKEIQLEAVIAASAKIISQAWGKSYDLKS